jgi:hypothetical protein
MKRGCSPFRTLQPGNGQSLATRKSESRLRPGGLLIQVKQRPSGQPELTITTGIHPNGCILVIKSRCLCSSLRKSMCSSSYSTRVHGKS